MKTILVDAVDAFVIEGKGINEEMYALLETYPNRKIVLTNADDGQMVKFGLNDLPYEVFTLNHNPDKTDPTYFKLMLKHFKLKAEDVIYFEHNENAVKSAQSLNIVSFHYKNDIKALKEFLAFKLH